MLKHHELCELLRYDPASGLFTWRRNRPGQIKRGDIAGTATKRGYVNIGVKRKKYLAHRLAWFYMTGEWPNDEVDHINGVRDDNSFENLREANRHQQNQNSLMRPGVSGLVGAQRDNNKGKWISSIRTKAGRINLGVFDDPIDAHHAYMQARNKYFSFQPDPRVADG